MTGVLFITRKYLSADLFQTTGGFLVNCRRMEKKTIISVSNLVKNYGNFKAVKGISFDVREGEIFGLLGPNGAGKSTTLEIIETLRTKTSGEVIVDGIDLDKNPDSIKKIIGVQLQSSGYYPNLNLTELLQLFGVL